MLKVIGATEVEGRPEVVTVLHVYLRLESGIEGRGNPVEAGRPLDTAGCVERALLIKLHEG